MFPSKLYTVLALPVALSQTTTTATILIPNWCITQSAPTVTLVNQNADLTTYSYSCSIDSSAVSSASAHASSAVQDAKSHASAVLASLDIHPPVHTNFARRDVNGCWNWGWGSGNACIPWEITQGPSIWAVHYTTVGIAGLDQECSFGPGGVESGSATCTADGRLDPGVWGWGDGVRTHTFDKDDVDRFWIRDAVPVTVGSGGSSGGAAKATTTTWSETGAARQTVVQGNEAVAGSTGGGVVIAMPTGMVAMAIGAGGVLFGAIAL